MFREVYGSIWAVFSAASVKVEAWRPVLEWFLTNFDTILEPKMMPKVSLDTQAKTKSLWVPIWTIYSKNLGLKRRCFEIPTCICVEYDVKCTITCNIAENYCKLQYFSEVAICHNHMFLHIFKRHCLDKSSSICCVQEEVPGRCFWGWKSVAVSSILGSKIRLVSIPIFRLGGTPPPPLPPPLPPSPGAKTSPAKLL